jgi:hypothetical protein
VRRNAAASDNNEWIAKNDAAVRGTIEGRRWRKRAEKGTKKAMWR